MAAAAVARCNFSDLFDVFLYNLKVCRLPGLLIPCVLTHLAVASGSCDFYQHFHLSSRPSNHKSHHRCRLFAANCIFWTGKRDFNRRVTRQVVSLTMRSAAEEVLQLALEQDRVPERPADGADPRASSPPPRSGKLPAGRVTKIPTEIIHHRKRKAREGRVERQRTSGRNHPREEPNGSTKDWPKAKDCPAPRQSQGRGRGRIRCLEPKWLRNS